MSNKAAAFEKLKELGHVPIEPANQYCKNCGVALFTSKVLLPCTGKATKTIRMVIEVDYNADTMYGNDADAKEWFFSSVLTSGDLLLHSNEIGDTIGEVRVLECSEI